MAKGKVGTSGLCGSELVARWACAHPQATSRETNRLVGTVIDGVKITIGHVRHGRKIVSDMKPKLHLKLGVSTGVFMVAAENIRSQSTARKAHDSRSKARKNAKSYADAVIDENSRLDDLADINKRKTRKDATKGKLIGPVLVDHPVPPRQLTVSPAAAADTSPVDDQNQLPPAESTRIEEMLAAGMTDDEIVKAIRVSRITAKLKS